MRVPFNIRIFFVDRKSFRGNFSFYENTKQVLKAATEDKGEGEEALLSFQQAVF